MAGVCTWPQAHKHTLPMGHLAALVFLCATAGVCPAPEAALGASGTWRTVKGQRRWQDCTASIPSPDAWSRYQACGPCHLTSDSPHVAREVLTFGHCQLQPWEADGTQNHVPVSQMKVYCWDTVMSWCSVVRLTEDICMASEGSRTWPSPPGHLEGCT
jgi:hypothetical protein